MSKKSYIPPRRIGRYIQDDLFDTREYYFNYRLVIIYLSLHQLLSRGLWKLGIDTIVT